MSDEVELLERGVYWRRALSAAGYPVAYAVDSFGREVRAESVADPRLAESTVQLLWAALDEFDPASDQSELATLPPLALVR